jgi:hypothetical protein
MSTTPIAWWAEYRDKGAGYDLPSVINMLERAQKRLGEAKEALEAASGHPGTLKDWGPLLNAEIESYSKVVEALNARLATLRSSH